MHRKSGDAIGGLKKALNLATFHDWRLNNIKYCILNVMILVDTCIIMGFLGQEFLFQSELIFVGDR